MLRITKMFAAIVVLVFALVPAGAQVDYQWDADAGAGGIQDGGGTWQVGVGNWDAGGTPNSNWADGVDPDWNNAVFGGGTAGTAGTVAITGTVNAGAVTLNDPFAGEYTFGGAGTLNTSGTLTKNGSATVTLGGTASINPGGAQISGGKVVIQTTVASEDGKVFRHNWVTELEIQGNGSLTVGGAPQCLFGDITLRDNAQMNLYGHGNWELDDGTGAPQANTMTVMDNATFTADRDGAAHGYTGTTGINTQGVGGFCFGLEWNQYSTVTFDQQGGTVNLTNPISDADPWGPGLVMAHGATGGGENIDHKYNLSGGVLNVSGVINIAAEAPTGPVASGGNGYAPVFNFNGGMLRASQDDSEDAGVVANGWNHLMANLWHAYVQEGGALIDTQNFDCSIDQVLEHDPDLVGTPDGGLLKLGDGTLTLLQESDYTGDTTVSGGILEILHAYLDDASSVSIASGADMILNFAGADTIGELILDGVPQAPGTYNVTTDPAYFSGTGSLLVFAYPGDLSGDGDVDIEDVGLFEMQFGSQAPGAYTADFDADGDVDLDDFLVMRDNMGYGVSAPLPGAAETPEPATMTVLAIGGLIVLRRRRLRINSQQPTRNVQPACRQAGNQVNGERQRRYAVCVCRLPAGRQVVVS